MSSLESSAVICVVYLVQVHIRKPQFIFIHGRYCNVLFHQKATWEHWWVVSQIVFGIVVPLTDVSTVRLRVANCKLKLLQTLQLDTNSLEKAHLGKWFVIGIFVV